jgi:agmatinase|tara:strand:+ start:588 stop:1499 length:912 start_codon:yes stop_codon:yes gene_type:complete
MQYLKQKKGFLGYEAFSKVESKAVVVPFGLEKSVSYGGGTKNGPKEIIKASHQVELFDEDLNKEPYKSIGIKTLKPIKIKKNLEAAIDQLAYINHYLKINKKFPLVLGGEHSITPGAIKPFAQTSKRLTIVHFDAHADLREKYNGEKFSHACAIKRCLDFKNVEVISIGIRSLSSPEMKFFNNNRDRIKIFWAKDKNNWKLNEIRKLVNMKNVYITFDVDAFDSSIMPATGTPEPGGLSWEDVIRIIKIVCKNSNVVGADINELAPIKNFDSYNFLIAKLAYKILSYTFEYKKKNTNFDQSIS